MTREQQLDWLCRLRSEIYVYMPQEWIKKMDEALTQSIKALEQEPCDDAVSRQWLMRKATERFYTTNYFNHITKMIEEAPSVRPQEHTGHWIETDDKYGAFFICDKCHRQSDIMENFCPNCGRRMVEPQESE